MMDFYIPEYGLPWKEMCPSPGGLIAEDHLWAALPAAGSITLVSAGESGGHHISHSCTAKRAGEVQSMEGGS